MMKPDVQRTFWHKKEIRAEIESYAADPAKLLRRMDEDRVERVGLINYVSPDLMGFTDEANETLGGLHVLVNNAGIARDRALWRMEDEEWKDVLETNLTGAFNMIRAVAPILRAQQHGKIVNVASVHGMRSEFGLANYAASKAGMIGLTRSAAIELGPSNVNVNAVAPGYIRTTRLTDGVSPEILDRARERSVLGRLGDPQDVANVVVFLCSEKARHITGAVVPVDGGHML